MRCSPHQVGRTDMLENKIIRGIEFGLVGGLAGTALMDVVMMITFVSVGERADMFFTMVGEKLGGGAILGVLLHNIIGTTGGFIFSLLVLSTNPPMLTTMRNGLKLGVAAGAITVPFGCIPLAVWLGEPIPGVIAFSILPHLVWGTVLGWTVAYGFLRLKTRS